LERLRPIVARLKDASLELPSPGDDRRRLIRAIKECTVVVCDCSVEPGHLYHKYVELPKVNNHVIICSRTPLPRNVYAFHQVAPTHGSTLTNEEIAQQLSALIPAVAESGASQHGYWERMAQSFDAQIRSAEERIGLFTSYRGRLEAAVQGKAAEVAGRIGIKSRVVPKGEFAYETECMTRQMMWATVARLEQEIHYARAFLLVRSDDYFDSFWTTTEYFIARFFHELPNREIQKRLCRDRRSSWCPRGVSKSIGRRRPNHPATPETICRSLATKRSRRRRTGNAPHPERHHGAALQGHRRSDRTLPRSFWRSMVEYGFGALPKLPPAPPERAASPLGTALRHRRLWLFSRGNSRVGWPKRNRSPLSKMRKGSRPGQPPHPSNDVDPRPPRTPMAAGNGND